MKKKIIIGFLIVVLICVVGFVAFYFVHNKGVEQNGVLEVDYPFGDRTPEHLAEVLGSYSVYVELRDSKLLKPVYEKVGDEVIERCSMQIVYDVHRGQKITWVSMAMRGEVTKIEGRTITITNQDETISLYVSEFAIIETDETERAFKDGEPLYIDGKPVYQHKEAKFEDIKVGDWLYLSVMIRADQLPQARAIMIATT